MIRFGNKKFIAITIAKLDQPAIRHREIDGMIALAVFSRQTGYDFCYGDSPLPFAIAVMHQRTSFHSDIIEFPNPAGAGFILMNDSKVPHFTSKIDAGLLLLEDADWSINRGGLAKCEKPIRLRAKLATPALSICAIGLQLHLSLHTIVTDHSSDLAHDSLVAKCPED